MDGVRESIDRSRRREIRLMTSTLTSVEVLASKIPAGFDHLFTNLLKRINRVSVDIKVAGIAHDLRDYYVVRQVEFDNKTLSTPDERRGLCDLTDCQSHGRVNRIAGSADPGRDGRQRIRCADSGRSPDNFRTVQVDPKRRCVTDFHAT
jgi:hypothetical protein